MSSRKKQRTSKKQKTDKNDTFSSCPLEAARLMLNLDSFDRRKLCKLKVDVVQPTSDILESLTDNVYALRENTDFKDWNEAKAREFVGSVLNSVATGLRPGFDIKVSNETTAAGQKRGKVDITLKLEGVVILAVEVKSESLRMGIAQNVLQLEAVRAQNLANGIDLGDTMFGVATTGSQWVLVKMVFNANAKPTAFATEIMTLSVKDGKQPKAALSKELELLHGSITQITAEQAKKVAELLPRIKSVKSKRKASKRRQPQAKKANKQ
jgi:hypothetical protein